MDTLIVPVLVLGLMGIVFAFILYYASTVFAVAQDPKVEKVRSALPGANCGACGYPGCDGLAEAIAKGEAEVNACPVGGEATAKEVAEVMGLAGVKVTKKVAVVKCQGNNDLADKKYDFHGHVDCRTIALNHGGNKLCSYGCLGGGSCKDVCEFGAIEINNGLAEIDRDKCTSCGKCVDVCPKSLIELMPYDMESPVLCSNHDKGKDVRKVCKVGCIGCTLCKKKYPEGFEINNFLSKASYDIENVDEEALDQAIKICPNHCIRPGLDLAQKEEQEKAKEEVKA